LNGEGSRCDGVGRPGGAGGEGRGGGKEGSTWMNCLHRTAASCRSCSSTAEERRISRSATPKPCWSENELNWASACRTTPPHSQLLPERARSHLSKCNRDGNTGAAGKRARDKWDVGDSRELLAWWRILASGDCVAARHWRSSSVVDISRPAPRKLSQRIERFLAQYVGCRRLPRQPAQRELWSFKV
jgi:hypothetical protein